MERAVLRVSRQKSPSVLVPWMNVSNDIPKPGRLDHQSHGVGRTAVKRCFFYLLTISTVRGFG
jgi:hypothetical protein